MSSQDDASVGGNGLPDYLSISISISEVGHSFARGGCEVRPHHLAPHGYLHAASEVALMDSACGFGCRASLPEGANSFTTIELKANFHGTARSGVATCEALMAHGGRNTQVWDAKAVHVETGKVIALFRCTQMILYPKG